MKAKIKLPTLLYSEHIQMLYLLKLNMRITDGILKNSDRNPRCIFVPVIVIRGVWKGALFVECCWLPFGDQEW